MWRPLEPDVFEAHFNLGNIFHDLGRYTEAQVCYRDALKLREAASDGDLLIVEGYDGPQPGER